MISDFFFKVLKSLCQEKYVYLKWIICQNLDFLIVELFIIHLCGCSHCTCNSITCNAAAVMSLNRRRPSSGLPPPAGLPAAADLFVHMAGHTAEECEALRQSGGVCDHGDADCSWASELQADSTTYPGVKSKGEFFFCLQQNSQIICFLTTLIFVFLFNHLDNLGPASEWRPTRFQDYSDSYK